MKKNTICKNCKFAKEIDGKFTCILLDLKENPQIDCDYYYPHVGRYDNIETARELISEVAQFGLSTQQHDLNRVGDILGNSGIDTLAKLANSDENIGNMTIGSRFYSIAFRVWNWEDATRFYNEHTLAVGVKLRENARKLDEAEKSITERDKSIEGLKAITEEQRLKMYELENDMGIAETAISEAKQEIITLKAKLYDLITAGA
jgi:chromosome segregation ATPase